LLLIRFSIKPTYITTFIIPTGTASQSQRSCGLRRTSATDRLLGPWVRISPTAWMFVSCECCVWSGRGLLPSVVCLNVIEKPNRRSLGPLGAVVPWEKVHYSCRFFSFRNCMSCELNSWPTVVFTSRHGVTSQKNRIFSSIAVRTSKLQIRDSLTMFRHWHDD